MREILVPQTGRALWGQQGENEAVTLRVTVPTDWKNGTVQAVFQPFGMAAHNVDCDFSGGAVLVPLTLQETQTEGEAMLEVQLHQGGMLAKSIIYRGEIGRSLGDASAPTTSAEQAFVDEMAALAAVVKEAGIGQRVDFDSLTDAQKASLRGEKGEKGDKGDPGADGKDGKDGAQGKSGVYIGSTPPEDAEVWIDPNGVPDDYTDAKISIMDACDAFEATGNPVVCHPAAGTQMGVTVNAVPMQDGTPGPDAPAAITVPTAAFTANGKAYTPELPESFEGGSVDCTKGKVSGQWKKVVYDGSERWVKQSVTSKVPSCRFRCARDDGFLRPTAVTQKAALVCSRFPAGTLNDSYYGTPSVGIGSSNGLIHLYWEAQERTVEEWTAQLAAWAAAGEPLTVYGKLAEADEESIPALSVPAAEGENTLTADADLTVTGYEDPRYSREVLREQINELRALVLEK